MKILFVTPTDLDCSSGGAIRSASIRDALQKVGEVDTVMFGWGESEFHDADWQEGRIRRARYCAYGRFSPEALRQRVRLRGWLRRILDEGAHDVIVVRYIATAYLLPTSMWSRVVIDADDFVLTVSGEETVSLRQRMFLALRNVATRKAVSTAAHVWYPKPADGPGLPTQRKSPLRNTVKLPPADRPRGVAIKGRILMVGLMLYGPNIQGARWFIENILPLLVAQDPAAQLHVVGKYHPHEWTWLHDDHVKLRGFVTDLAAEYDQASLVIAPILHGGGTQIKVIDALAHGRPLVASAFAYGGFAQDLRPGTHLQVAATVEDWVRHCLWVLQEARAAQEMALHGQSAAAAYDSAGIEEHVRQTLRSLVHRD